MKVNKIRMRETLVSYAFLAPILLFFTVFVLAPMIMGFVTSFFNYSMTSFKFVGLENYSRMFADKVFSEVLDQYRHHRYRIRSDRRIVLLVCGFSDLPSKCDCAFLLSFRLLPSSCYRECSGNELYGNGSMIHYQGF